MNNDLTIQLIITIVGSIITSIITKWSRSIWSFCKRLFTKGKMKRTDTSTLTTKVTTSHIKFTLLDSIFIGIDLVPILLNSILLYILIGVSTPITRIEVLAIFVNAGSIIYWLRDMASKIKRYRVKN